MSNIQCIEIVNKEFKGAIQVDCAMNFNITDISDIGLAVNTSKLKLSTIQEEVTLDTPIEIPVDCINPDGNFKIDKITLNKVIADGVINFNVSLNIFNSSNVKIDAHPDYNVSLAWPSASGQVCVDNELLAYAENLNDNYELSVTATNVQLEQVIEDVQSNSYIFLISGGFLVEATLK